MRTLNVVIAYAVTLSILIGCDGRIEPPPIEGPSLTTPAGTIELIEVAFNRRDVDELKECLTGDFTFHFDPEVIGNPVGDYTIPESWNRADFFYAVSRMFNTAFSVDISIVSANVGEPDPDDAYYTADNVQIRFLVMVDIIGGYLAQGFVTFEFRKEVNEKNEQEWLVTAWRDFTAPDSTGDRNIVPASFGEILVRFRK